MKVDYEKKLKARKEVICDEETRRKLIAQRERLTRETEKHNFHNACEPW